MHATGRNVNQAFETEWRDRARRVGYPLTSRVWYSEDLYDAGKANLSEWANYRQVSPQILFLKSRRRGRVQPVWFR